MCVKVFAARVESRQLAMYVVENEGRGTARTMAATRKAEGRWGRRSVTRMLGSCIRRIHGEAPIHLRYLRLKNPRIHLNRCLSHAQLMFESAGLEPKPRIAGQTCKHCLASFSAAPKTPSISIGKWHESDNVQSLRMAIRTWSSQQLSIPDLKHRAQGLVSLHFARESLH